MTQPQFALVATLIVLPMTGGIVCCLAMLERIEKHLRELHLKSLGPLPDQTADDRAARRRLLGLDDGYPQRQLNMVMLAFVSMIAVIYLGTRYLGW